MVGNSLPRNGTGNSNRFSSSRPDKPEVAMKKHDLQSGRCAPKIGFKKKKTLKGRAKFESVDLAQSQNSSGR